MAGASVKTLTDILIDIRGTGDNIDNPGVAANALLEVSPIGGIWQRVKDIKKALDSDVSLYETDKADFNAKYADIASDVHSGNPGKYGDIVVKYNDLIVKYADFAGADGVSGKFKVFEDHYTVIEPRLGEIGVVSADLSYDLDGSGVTSSKINEVAAGLPEVTIVAGKLSEATNTIQTVSDNITGTGTMETVGLDLQGSDTIGIVAGSITAVVQTATDSVVINDVYTNRVKIYGAVDSAAAALADSVTATDAALGAVSTADEAMDVFTKTYTAGAPIDTAKYSASHYREKAKLLRWEAEASELTTHSYAMQPEDDEVIVYTSNEDGTFVPTAQTGEYSGLHYLAKNSQLLSTFSSIGVLYAVADTVGRDALVGLTVGDAVRVTDSGSGRMDVRCCYSSYRWAR